MGRSIVGDSVGSHTGETERSGRSAKDTDTFRGSDTSSDSCVVSLRRVKLHKLVEVHTVEWK